MSFSFRFDNLVHYTSKYRDSFFTKKLVKLMKNLSQKYLRPGEHIIGTLAFLFFMRFSFYAAFGLPLYGRFACQIFNYSTGDDTVEDEVSLDLQDHNVKEAIQLVKLHLRTLSGIPCKSSNFSYSSNHNNA